LLNAESGPLILPAPVATEVDYLLGQRFGRSARRAFLADIASARFLVACLEQTDYQLVLAYDERYADLDVGLADLSVVVIAHRFSTKRILTLDQRHFRALRPLDGEHFILLPFDADVPAT
jgi:predicted nucleic acid-binding protein